MGSGDDDDERSSLVGGTRERDGVCDAEREYSWCREGMPLFVFCPAASLLIGLPLSGLACPWAVCWAVFCRALAAVQSAIRGSSLPLATYLDEIVTSE